MWKWKVGIVLLIAALICSASGISREKRSPFKKHKIVIGEGQQSEGEIGWSAPAPPLPQQETIVEHHHHWEGAPPPPNPPPQVYYQPPATHSHSVVIEVNKGGHGGKDEKIKQFKEELDASFDAMERDKQEKLEAFKKDAEEKLDALAQIPHMIASDIDFIGKKIMEDLEKKKQKDEGISIQVWKGKGSTSHSGSSSSSSEGTVHHHHYYNEQPPPPQRQPAPQPPPPAPPRKQYYADDSDPLEGLYKVADAGTQFINFFAGGGSAGSSGYESGEGWQQGGGGGKGKGFRVNVWKSKGFRRRK